MALPASTSSVDLSSSTSRQRSCATQQSEGAVEPSRARWIGWRRTRWLRWSPRLSPPAPAAAPGLADIDVAAEPGNSSSAHRPARPGWTRRATRRADLRLSAWSLNSDRLLISLLILWARPARSPIQLLRVTDNSTTLIADAAPSWKPLPYLFTAPYGLFGHYAAAAVDGHVGGGRRWPDAVFAGRIAFRLTDARLRVGAGRAFGAAGFSRGSACCGISCYWHYVLSAQSDPMIVALCLAAIDCHLRRARTAGRSRSVRWRARPPGGVGRCSASIGLWLWRRGSPTAMADRERDRAAGRDVVRDPGADLAEPVRGRVERARSGRRLRSDRVFGTIGRFLDLNPAVIELTALVAVAIAVARRDRVTLALAAGVCAWVIVEIAFSLHGWPGLGRYMFEPAAVLIAIAGVGVGSLLVDPPRISRVAGWAGVALVAVIVIALVPPALSRARSEHHDIVGQRTRTAQINQLTGVISRLGGASRFKPCGEPLTRLEYQTILAWNLHVNVATVGYKYGPAVAGHRPIVMFTPLAQGGWLVRALHQRLPGCASLPH